MPLQQESMNGQNPDTAQQHTLTRPASTACIARTSTDDPDSARRDSRSPAVSCGSIDVPHCATTGPASMPRVMRNTVTPVAWRGCDVTTTSDDPGR